MKIKNNIAFYIAEKGTTKIEVVLQNEDVWLNVNAIAELFDVQRPAIYKHISNIFTEEELDEKSVCSILEYTVSDSENYKTKYYNLDMIISIISNKHINIKLCDGKENSDFAIVISIIILGR